MDLLVSLHIYRCIELAPRLNAERRRRRLPMARRVRILLAADASMLLHRCLLGAAMQAIKRNSAVRWVELPGGTRQRPGPETYASGI